MFCIVILNEKMKQNINQALWIPIFFYCRRKILDLCRKFGGRGAALDSVLKRSAAAERNPVKYGAHNERFSVRRRNGGHCIQII